MADKIPAFFSKLQKDCSTAIAAYEAKTQVTNKLYAGDPYLHWITGGISLGKVNIFYGRAGSGKSSISWYLAGLAQQRKPGSWVFIQDSEYYFADDPDRVKRLEKFGIDIERVFILPTKDLNESFGRIFEMYEAIKAGELILAAWIIDSWKGYENRAQMKKIIAGKADEASDATRGNAKQMNPILDQVVKIAAVSRCLMIVTQHCAQNQEQYGPDFLLPGGEALRHNADCIIYFEGLNGSDAKLAEGDVIIAKSDYETEKVGKRIKGRAEKTRNTVEGKTCEFWFNFAEGRFVMQEESLFALADRLGHIYHPLNDDGKPVVAHWCFGKEIRIVGKEKFIEEMKTNKDLYNEIQSVCFGKDIMQIPDEPIVMPQELASSKKKSKIDGAKK